MSFRNLAVAAAVSSLLIASQSQIAGAALAPAAFQAAQQSMRTLRNPGPYQQAPQTIAADSRSQKATATRPKPAKANASTGPLIWTLAGGLPSGTTLGTALNTQLGSPAGIAFDSHGNTYVAQSDLNRVIKIPASGNATVVAGTGASGNGGDGGLATAAQLTHPTAIAVDASGNLFIADMQNNLIRMVTAATGVISTLDVAVFFPNALAIGANGDLLVAAFDLDADAYDIQDVDFVHGSVTILAGGQQLGSTCVEQVDEYGDGCPATEAYIGYPAGVAESGGKLYVTDIDVSEVRVVDLTSGIIQNFAGTAGRFGFSGDGGPATSAVLDYPSSIAVDASGNVFFLDLTNDRVREVDHATGKIATIAGTGTYGFSGDGGSATAAELAPGSYETGQMAFNLAGALVLSDTGNQRLRAISSGTINTIAGNGLDNFYGDGGPAAQAGIANPAGAVADASGNLFIAEQGNLRVRKVDARTGTISTVAGTGQLISNGDGGPASSASLCPNGVAVDASGNLFVSDVCADSIREISAQTGKVSTLVGLAAYIGDMTLAGNLLFVTEPDSSEIVSVNLTTKQVTVVAGDGDTGFSGDGGPAIDAELHYPEGISVVGNVLYFADYANEMRQVNLTSGIINKVGTSSQFSEPNGVWGSGQDLFGAQQGGTVYLYGIADGRYTLYAGTQSYSGYAGDDGPATSALMGRHLRLAGDAATGELDIVDSLNNAVRLVSQYPFASLLKVTASPNPVTLGQSVTLTATFTNPLYGIYPTGKVSFLFNGGSIGSGTISNGVASLKASTAGQPAGSYAIKASYVGDANYAAATSAAVNVTIAAAKKASTTTVTATPNPVPANSNVTLKATVSGAFGTATGTVNFVANGEAIGHCTLAGGTCSLNASNSGIAAGTYPVQANYAGSSVYATSSGTVKVTVK